MATQAERQSATEAEVRALRADVTEIKGDVKTLLAAHNRQQGFMALGQLLWGGLCAGLALVGDWLVHNWHSLVSK